MSLDIIQQPFAFQGDVDQPGQTSATGFVNFQDGYTKDYEISLASGNPQAKAVERMVQNYMFNQATEHAMAWQRRAMPPWFAGMSDPSIGGYPKDAFVIRQQADLSWKPYRSLVANNVSDPLTTPAQWEYVRNGSEALALIPMPSGAGNAAAELIVVGVDFNTLTASGTYEVRDEVVAAACTNLPVTIDGQLSGVLEVKSWSDSTPAVRVIQRYTSSAGRIAVRYAIGAVWTGWTYDAFHTDVRNQKFTFCTATNPVNENAIVLVATPAMTSRSEGMRLQFKAVANSTGAVTVDDGISIKPLLGYGGVALIGGEVKNNFNAVIEWNVALDSWLLVGCQASALQLPTSSYVSASPAQFDVTKKVATMEALQRALGNYQDAVQLAVGATTNLTQLGVGKYLQAQGGTINLPLASSVKAGSAFIITSSASSPTPTVVSRTGSDTIFVGGSGFTSITMGDGDFMVVIALAAGVWEAFGTMGATAAQFDNSRRYASTAFVQRALGNFKATLVPTSSTVLVAADAGSNIVFGGTTGGTITLPLTSAIQAGCAFSIMNHSSQNVSVATQGGELIRLASGIVVSSVTLSPGDSVSVVFFAAGSYAAFGGSAQLGFSGSLSSLKSGNGYQKLPSGIIIQWGSVVVNMPTANTLVNTVVTFPIAFPNTVLSVNSTPSNCPAAYINTSSESFAANQFTLVTAIGIAPGNATVRYVAFGY